jgi:D-arabinono-1,4-lactone oxidase
MRFEHPASEAELVALVERARRERAQLRVRGSLHSVGTAIWTDPGSRNINVQLDRYNRIVAFDEANRRVTVQAGMHLGVDPRDPNSNPDNSLLYALNRRGWALPDLGGITHQTVGGFLSTGSAGGSVFHDVGESLAGVRIVAGDGKIYELVPAPDRPGDAEENPFFAAGVAMGLLGILSTATFQCVESFDIIGRQITRSFAQSPVDLFGSRGGGLRNFLEVNEYNRLLVFPQPKVERVQFWSARRAGPGDRSVIFKRGERTRKPLQAMPEALENIAYRIYEHVDKTEPPYDDRKTEFMRDMLRLFMPDTDERFWDRWYLALPMDNQVSDELMPTEFTELFIDIDKTEAVMRELDAFWRADRNMERTGPFATEIYPAKASKFWLAASHGQNSVRIDVFWFKTGQTDPSRAFYPRYWQLLEKYGFRFHWGKHLSSPDSSTGIEYRRKQLPKWDQFLRLRERLDPDQIFVSSYWRKHLGIPGR